MTDDYWISYNSYEGPGLSYHSDGFMISVVLDAGIRNYFEGIRIVIAYEETALCNNVQIRNCIQTERHGLKPSPCEPISNRDLILSHRRPREWNFDTPIFTFTFKVVLQRIGDRVRATLKPQGSVFPSYLRVAYDATFPTHSGSVVNFFESNLSFCAFDKDIAAPHAVYRLCAPPRGLPAYSARVLPVLRMSRTHELPSSILRAIAEAAVDHQQHGWRSELLSVGTVCKAWSCMLDAFFVILTGDTCTSDPPDPFAVAHALELKPDRGQLMRCFRLDDYAGLLKGIDNEERYINRCRAILTILTCATDIKSIHLPGIHTSLRKEAMQVLSRLRCVESCTIYDRDSHMGKIVEFTIGEIQQFIAEWAGLRCIDIAFRTIVSTRAFDDEVPELKCNLENLRLRTSHLTGRQFVRFTSSHLQKVELDRLQGPLNRDLFAFLSAAAPSLSSLSIRSCSFQRQSMNEEYAIDSLMHRFCSLEELVISGDLLTAQAIREKGPPRNPLAVMNFSATLAPGLYLDELSDALETSGWKTVTIKTMPGYMDEEELLMKEEVFQAAARRNIAFAYNPVC